MKNIMNRHLILFAHRRIFLLILFGLLLTNMLLPMDAHAFDSSSYSGDKTMSDTLKQADQKTPIVINMEQHPGKERSQAQIKQQEASYEAPYPFTAEELWEKLLKVVELPDGHVTKEQVEKIFGVTLKLDEDYLKKFHGYLYNLKDESINISFIEDSTTESHFRFEWGQIAGRHPAVFPSPPYGMCINSLELMPSIEKRGWALKRETRNIRDLLNSNDYRKGGMGVLRISFFPHDSCLASIDVFTSKLADQLVP